MPSYLVETYLARGHGGERSALERRARSAAEELTREGARVRYEGSIHVPEDEICFFTFEASTGREVVLAAQRAALAPLRVVEAISSGTVVSGPDDRGESASSSPTESSERSRNEHS